MSIWKSAYKDFLHLNKVKDFIQFFMTSRNIDVLKTLIMNLTLRKEHRFCFIDAYHSDVNDKETNF